LFADPRSFPHSFGHFNLFAAVSRDLDLLVNNAIIAIVKPFEEITPVDRANPLVNVTSFLLTQHFALDAAGLKHR
jgi:hypothetical protein